MSGRRSGFIYLTVLAVLLLTVASGWGMNREAVSDRLILCTENNRVDLDNPFFQGNFGYRYPLDCRTELTAWNRPWHSSTTAS
jgi:hypothetical protein